MGELHVKDTLDVQRLDEDFFEVDIGKSNSMVAEDQRSVFRERASRLTHLLSNGKGGSIV
ncbi:hypothetical protein A6M27_00925 [Acidithiobacillus thiooxidans]|jgi:hypothetical protein|uniref:Uncharacterized protein n=2 Tax=Acidithiobacillus thiooxidans TaxID=930 RepID=A0A1C2J7L1_ACITH|nr:hypothetical protein [Acidithiobacillus thiooxidans]MBU2743643.1 hypothetical protein [Acidithiobacillus albertensis]QFX96487.1 hypothetical protein GCD22_02271 [Acidithiobacillus thiooxidans ATCC 19377]OCX74432.1 hypothetical protein A6P07_05640 [Acidithiobacillus thiooxidans]OCX79250.1 hypothetical protein A6O24_02215 [Acidithiobacillus thiooxidans]OCX84227.1 hypothetical protein A6O26_04900 [Acidithiobacillus thiooxidans]